MTVALDTRLPLHDLDRRIAGAVVEPGETGWDQARQAWNLAVDQQPAAVVLPHSAGDVAQAVRFANRHDLRIAMQTTGHAAAALGPLADTLLVKTQRMRGVTIDPAARTARVEAGAVWADVVPRADEHDLAALAGSAHDVGVAGYVLGGGVSWLARRHGLAADRVARLEVVTAEGRLVRVDADHEPDLFWALRGGGGAFGAVTAIHLELLPLTRVHAGQLLFAPERAREVFHAWRRFTGHAPEDITSAVRVMGFPPAPQVPEPLRGRRFAIVEVAALADPREHLRELRALGPEADTIRTQRPRDLLALHNDPPGPVPGQADHQLLDTLTPQATDAIVDHLSPALLSYELRHWGGAARRPRPGHGALGAIAADYATFGVGLPGPEAAQALERMRAAVAPHAAATEYLNFSERPIDAAFDALTLARLRRVKRAYDPEDRFRSNKPL